MSQVEDLIEGQVEVGESIKKILINYQKDGKQRKTIEYCQRRLEVLEKLWMDFVDRHNKITVDAKHPYSASKVYEQVEDRYKITKMILEEKLEEVSNQLPKPQPIPREKAQLTNLMKLINLQNVKIDGLLKIINSATGQLTEANPEAYYVQTSNHINQYWTKICDVNDKLIEEASEEDLSNPYFTENHYQEIEGRYQEIMIELQGKIISFQRPAKKQETPDGLRLPRINIPSFSGSFDSWIQFHDIFHQTIHLNQNLSKSQKLHYLKSNITGEAASLIKHLNLSDENYETAWNLLKNRYDNKRMLVNTQIATLLNIQPLTQENTYALKKLHDTTIECINALQNLDINTEEWDPILVYMIIQKLDKETVKAFEQSLDNPKDVQPIKTLLNFIETRFQTLENLRTNKEKFNPTTCEKWKNRVHHTTHLFMENCCNICKGPHRNFECKKYLSLAPSQRLSTIKDLKLCFNCITKHQFRACKNEKRCLYCKQRHHTTLHQALQQNNKHIPNTNEKTPPTNTHPETISAHCNQNCTTTLLATALLEIKPNEETIVTVRALIDQGSQASFVTEEIAQRCKLPRKRIEAVVSGLGSKPNNMVQWMTTMQLFSKQSDYCVKIDAFILPKITKALPEQYFENEWHHVNSLPLADPKFNQPGKIDLLLGAAAYQEIVTDGIIKGATGVPLAQKTHLGWILSGKTTSMIKTQIKSFTILTEINDQLKKFWELEELNINKIYTEEEKKCEFIFEDTHHRRENGSYVVNLPFVEDPNMLLGDSRKQAVSRFLSLERKLQQNPSLNTAYRAFINEYLSLDHMRETIPSNQFKNYLPHHAVFKETSTTTKLRVVFDASCKTTNGTSLNECLLNGPTIQQDLWTIILRWRKYRYAYTADIEKMYRQIGVSEEHQNYQYILWRNSPNSPIKEYALTTVTYGTKSAPYLAIRTLHQLAKDEKQNYPIASEILKEDFYVDDLLSGSDTKEEALRAQNELISLLSKGGFTLRKWNSNCNTLLENLPPALKEVQTKHLEKENTTIRTLGVTWNPLSDEFEFDIPIQTSSTRPTKRTLLSEGSKIFDPLGWMSPITISVKILFQETWMQGIQWDQELPDSIATKWIRIKSSLHQLRNIKIPRWNGIKQGVNIEIHGFSDASERAYAAVLYTRIPKDNNAFEIKLLCAKTRVAPLKKISLPRLELCGATLLANLIDQTIKAMKIQHPKVFAWTDSTIVLAWLKSHPTKWKSFVATRVSEIQHLTRPNDWHHIDSKNNPADCASRGLEVSQALEHELWWNGPKFLKTDFKTTNKTMETTLEIKTKINVHHIAIDESFDIVNRHSSLSKLKRIIAYCLRFIHNSRKPKTERLEGRLTVIELENSFEQIIKITQQKTFAEEKTSLQRYNRVQNKSSLKKFNPWLDENNILRIGGRIEQANLTADEKHPIILPYKDSVTKLIIQESHLKTLHGGNKLTLAETRKRFWIINGINAVKTFIHHCVKCQRFKTQPTTQLMGHLPKERVTLDKPFTNSGVDYAGPISIRPSKGRGVKSQKAYIALFVCMATKAVHLEAVSDLTADAYLAAFKRFSARRGHIKNIFSDNATNFLKASRIFNNGQIETTLTDNGTQFKFIPPASPHFGGLWEAGINSVKRHLKKTIGEERLTFEELSTLLSQIESVLNSRPLGPISSDPDNFEVLTPAHFIIGTAPININHQGLSTRWNLIQKYYEIVSKKWKTDYLHQLQHRPKWHRVKSDIKVGNLVLIKDQHTSPTKWPLGRIIDIHPGIDGLTRVLTLKTATGLLKRSLSKVCLLPNWEDNQEPTNAVQTQVSTPQPISDKTSHQSLNSEETRRVTRSRNKLLSTPLLFMMSLLYLITNISGQKPITHQINQIESTAGIYFEDLGHANLIKAEWNIIIYYNLTSYWLELKGLQECVNKLTYTCLNQNEADRRDYCTATIKQLNYELDTLTDNNQLLQQEQFRKKRSPLDIVGKFGNMLFGILDQDYANQIEDKIHKVNNNEQFLLEMLKNHTSLLKATSNIIKKTIDDHQNEITHFNNHLKLLQMEENFTSTFSLLATYTALLLSSYQHAQDAIINVLTDTRHGTINPLLISPTQMHDQLDIIRRNIPNNLRIPQVNDKNDILQFYKLLKIQSRLTRNNIIINLKVPLTSTEEYQMLHLIPVPVVHNHDLIAISPSSDYILVNPQRTHVYPLSEQDVQQCHQSEASHLLCEQRHPIYTNKGNQSQCELRILAHEQELSPWCKLLVQTTATMIHQLHQTNSWIFFANRTMILDLICGGSVETVKLMGVGILNISEGCMLKHESMLINTYTKHTSQLKSSILPTTNLSHQLTLQGLNVNFKRYTTNISVSELQHDLKAQQRAEVHLPNQLNRHDIHHYTMTYITVTLLITLVITWTVRKKKQSTTPDTIIV